jgi:DNA-binding MarR family transcriptional regulator
MEKTPHREPPEEAFLPPAPPEDDFVESDQMYVFRHIGVIERMQRKVHRTIFNQYGLHPSQGIALMTIIQNPGQSQRELADRLHIERATLTVMVQKLEKGGFIERRPDPDDQRILRLHPTEKGMEADRKTHEACESFVEFCFRDMDAEARAVMAQQLRAIEDRMDRFNAALLAKKESRS